MKLMLLQQIQYSDYTYPIMPQAITWLSAYSEEMMKFEARLQTQPLYANEKKSTTIEEMPLNIFRRSKT